MLGGRVVESQVTAGPVIEVLELLGSYEGGSWGLEEVSNAEKTAGPISERSELSEASNPTVHV